MAQYAALSCASIWRSSGDPFDVARILMMILNRSIERCPRAFCPLHVLIHPSVAAPMNFSCCSEIVELMCCAPGSSAGGPTSTRECHRAPAWPCSHASRDGALRELVVCHTVCGLYWGAHLFEGWQKMRLPVVWRIRRCQKTFFFFTEIKKRRIWDSNPGG